MGELRTEAFRSELLRTSRLSCAGCGRRVHLGRLRRSMDGRHLCCPRCWTRRLAGAALQLLGGAAEDEPRGHAQDQGLPRCIDASYGVHNLDGALLRDPSAEISGHCSNSYSIIPTVVTERALIPAPLVPANVSEPSNMIVNANTSLDPKLAT